MEWTVPGAFHVKGKEAFDKEIEHTDFIGPPDIHIARLVEENNIVVAEGTVRTKKKTGESMTILFCDVFVMQDQKIKQLTSYLVAQ